MNTTLPTLKAVLIPFFVGAVFGVFIYEITNTSDAKSGKDAAVQTTSSVHANYRAEQTTHAPTSYVFRKNYEGPTPNWGCQRIHRENVHPGGFGASLMRFLWKYEQIFLNEERDMFYSGSTWSYRCNDTLTWECYFRQGLACPDPELGGKYKRQGKKHSLISNWMSVEPRERNESNVTPEFKKYISHLKALQPTRTKFFRYLASRLLSLQDKKVEEVEQYILSKGLNLSEAFVSLHIRRGDKLREMSSSSPSQELMITKIKELAPEFKWIFILTDDANAIKEFQEANPGWEIRSFVRESNASTSFGFNECMLPSVRSVRQSACVNQCKNLTAAMRGSSRRRSFCFMNPHEQNDSKLVPVPVPSPDSNIQEEAGFAMLVDIWVATHSKIHFAEGCGSNVDKLIHVLRKAPIETTICFDIKGSAPDCRKAKPCLLRQCDINPEAAALGLNCKTSSFPSH
eukprot:m.193140 g.193140  ORF g.193140 m.193140 type:complete len:457 (-) comp15663_c0_seq3:1688-3058(-)